MAAPEDVPEANTPGPGSSGMPNQAPAFYGAQTPLPVIPPWPLHDPAALSREDWQEKSHRPAAALSGLVAGGLGATVAGFYLTHARADCIGVLGGDPNGPLCPYVSVPGFDVTLAAFLLGLVLAGLAYAAVYAVVYLSHALRG